MAEVGNWKKIGHEDLKKKQPAEGPNNLLEGPHVVISIVSGSMVAQGWLVWS